MRSSGCFLVFWGCATSCVRASQPAPAHAPRYSIEVRLREDAPRLSAEAVVSLPRPDTGRASFVLAELLTLESVDVVEEAEFRRAAVDSTFLPGSRPGWGNVRWSLGPTDDLQRRASATLTLRIRYRLDTAAAAFVFGVDEVVAFASGINSAWYPQVEDGPSATVGRVRTKRGTGTIAFDIPDGVRVYAVGSPLPAQSASRVSFHVDTPAYFNFAAARYQVRESPMSSDGSPHTATFYLSPRDSTGSYLAQSMAVLRVLSTEFGAYPFPRFALVEIPTALAERAGFAGASTDGAIFTTSEYLNQPFNLAYYGHEIGHQWWGVTVRPVGPRGTWMLSEGLAQYGALRTVEALGGEAIARTFRRHEYPDYFGQGGDLYFRTVSAGHDSALADLPTNESWSREIADSKGFMSLHALANEMGRERLRVAFSEIHREFAERRLSWDDFLAAVTRAAGREMSWFYRQWFDRSGAPELIADLVDSSRQVRVRQLGDPYVLTVELGLYGRGCGSRLRLLVAAEVAHAPVPAGCRADSVVVDPDHHVLRWTPERRARHRSR